MMMMILKCNVETFVDKDDLIHKHINIFSLYMCLMLYVVMMLRREYLTE